MLAHCTVEELYVRGGTREDWESNDQAYHDAKEGMRHWAQPIVLCQLRAQQLDAEARIMWVISEIQCRGLATMPRFKLADSAAKSRKRKAPALPAALRQRTRAVKHKHELDEDDVKPMFGLEDPACL